MKSFRITLLNGCLLSALLLAAACTHAGQRSAEATAAPSHKAAAQGAVAENVAEDGVKKVAVNLLQQIKATGTIRIGVKADSPPFGFKLGAAYAGFDIDIAGAVARELGANKIEYVPLVSSQRTPMLLNGSVDLVIANMTLTRGREQDIDFSLPYFEDGQMLLVSKDSSITNYLDLSGKAVACIKGSTSEKNIHIVAPAAQFKVYKSNAEMIKALQSGEVEAITTDSTVLESIHNKNKDLGFKLVGKHFSEEPLAIGLPENQSDLRDAVNDALQQMAETGEWQSIYDTWFGPNSGFQHTREFHVQTYPK